MKEQQKQHMLDELDDIINDICLGERDMWMISVKLATLRDLIEKIPENSQETIDNGDF